MDASSFADLNVSDPNFAVDAVDLLLQLAIDRSASDLHLHPRTSGWDVLLRIDGVLLPVGTLPGGSNSDPVTRLMVIASLPTYRSSQPMEGRIQWDRSQVDLCSNAISMRLGVYPTVHGPRAVVRLLRRDQGLETIASLGLSDHATSKLATLSQQTDGAVFLSGPAGSGKTTTMYAMLRQIAAETPRRSVLTIEDPVESVIDSISQSDLDPSGGMTLASALRSAVRQDSEVLLVSEIRDPETAEAALQASLTGHLVFSSLHASDVAATLRRIVQLGVPPFVIRSSIRAVINQRLMRRSCPGGDASAAEVTKSDVASRCGGENCEYCLGTGYRGRVAVTQLALFDGSDPVGDAMLDALESNASLPIIRAASKSAGGVSLRGEAERLVQAGLTDDAEVFRVLGSS